MALEFTASESIVVPATAEVTYPNYKLRRVTILIREQTNSVGYRAVCVPIDSNGASMLTDQPIVIQQDNIYGIGYDSQVVEFVNKLGNITQALGRMSGDFA